MAICLQPWIKLLISNMHSIPQSISYSIPAIRDTQQKLISMVLSSCNIIQGMKLDPR